MIKMSEIMKNINKAMETRKWAIATANCEECQKLFPDGTCDKHQKQLEELKKKYV